MDVADYTSLKRRENVADYTSLETDKGFLWTEYVGPQQWIVAQQNSFNSFLGKTNYVIKYNI